LNSTKEKKLQTRKNLSAKQYQNMGEFKFTTRERSKISLEKTLPTQKVVAQEKPITPQKKPVKKQEVVTNPMVAESQSEADQIVNAVLNARKYIVEEISASFEKKIEKLDDAIVELINCKVENERLKGKIDNMTRDNYRLKRELNRYKSVVPGLYIKTHKDGFDL